MKIVLAGAALTSLLAAAPAFADEALAKKHNCTACHALDKKVVGPAFREVAAKYAGDAGAGLRLAAKIKAGGQGNWGNVPMPPNPGLSDQELQTLTRWILGHQ